MNYKRKKSTVFSFICISVLALGFLSYLLINLRPKAVTPTKSVGIQNKTYSNSKYQYSFQYPSIFNYRNGSGAINSPNEISPLMFLTIGDNQDGSQDLSVVVITKNLPEGYYDSRDYNVFTSNLDKILKMSIGKNLELPMIGSILRMKDTLIDSKNTLAFESLTHGDRFYVVETQSFYYVLTYNPVYDSVIQPILTTFQFE